jgi:hypothetical protein
MQLLGTLCNNTPQAGNAYDETNAGWVATVLQICLRMQLQLIPAWSWI